MTRSECFRAAHLAAIALLRCADGCIADRLEIKRGKPVEAEAGMGGWCFTAARDRIQDVLIAEMEKQRRNRKRKTKVPA